MVNLAFQKLDANKDGVITVDDMKGVFNYDQHPLYVTGQRSQEDIFTDFLHTFEMDGHVDGKVGVFERLKNLTWPF